MQFTAVDAYGRAISRPQYDWSWLLDGEAEGETFADQLRWVLQCTISVQIFLLYTVCHHCNSVATNLAPRQMGRTNANGGVGGVWPAHSAHVRR